MYGFKCDMDALYKDLSDAHVLSTIEDAADICPIDVNALDDIQKFKHKLNINYSNICRDCETST